MSDDKDSVKKAKHHWQKETAKGSKNRLKRYMTTSSEDIPMLVTPDDLPEFDYMDKLGFPGEYPFTRGIHSNMYRGRLWTMRMFSGHGSPEDTNERYKFLLKKGQTGLSVAFDLPTLMGRDSDDPWAEGEVGKCGVAVCSLRDMEALFDGISLEKVSTSMTINSPAAILWAFYIAAAEKQGAKRENLRGTIQNDILKEYIAQKEFIFPPGPSLRLIVDTIEFGTNELPQWNTISISGYHIREAGATAAQELAFTLKDGFTYIEAALERGLEIDEFAPRLSLFFDSHLDFFEEIAKFRAARRIWGKQLKEKYKAKNPRSWLCRFHTQTAGCSLTAQQPENNLVRTAFQAMAAVLGGTQSLHTNSMDETWALPSAKAAKLALRTQQVLAEETGVANPIDPLGGSYFVEWLTDIIQEMAEEYFDRIDDIGGMVPAIENGFPQKEIAAAAYRYQQEIDKRERLIVGVNEYVDEDEKLEIPILKITEEMVNRQVGNLKELRKRRDSAEVKEKLIALREAAEGTDNLMPHFIDCAHAYCTLGEMVGVLKEVFSEYTEPAFF
ncbi:methylmalonyl-CoA mutase [candidate division LCP-89 bacterium B3_LCP]|uniref:Methylmalonyl-CoA mutase n=1 Tax=candidate division LCP-89 bacterium B3_LCP TaxID=2012998 RepID=A0A532V531_UNCL8|nr:MAG: methylmalonyl-CoA mutase [candidate division LCP-89 bacterium B3_LCP]